MKEQRSNPKLYRELSVPFESTGAADKALGLFAEDLYALRVKHRIPDLACVVQVNASSPEGEEGVMSATICCGDSLNKAVMLAQALGREQGNLTSAIASCLRKR